VPTVGPLSVTVPGGVAGWFALLERFGTWSFAELAAPALRLAAEGFAVSEQAAASVARAKARFSWSNSWLRVYGDVHAGDRLRQPDLARSIQALADDGPDAFYRGQIAAAIVEFVRGRGGLLGGEDRASHRGEWGEPMGRPYGSVEVLELPPNTQGVAVLEALRILVELGALPPAGAARQHVLIEATKLALADRDAYLTDPADMAIDPEELLA